LPDGIFPGGCIRAERVICARLKHWGSQVQSQLIALPAHFGLTARRSFASASLAVQRWSGAAYRTTRAAFLTASRSLKAWAFRTLAPVEAVLLSASGRERIHASATFALIFLFAVTSVDFLINGGPEFGSPARAAQPQHILRAAVSPAPMAGETVAEPVPTALASTLADVREARVTSVSQSFEPPPVARPELAALSADLTPLDAGAADLSQPISGDDVDVSANEAPAQDARPHKHARVKDQP
jgi:hypothetical protein